MTVNTTTGLISGTPTAAGVYSVTLGATNDVGPSVPKTLTITVSLPVAPAITSPLSVNGIDGSPFNYRITATGIGPIVFSVTGLPPGLSLVQDNIAGTTVNGVYNVILTAYSPATNPAFPGGPANPLAIAPTTAQLTINISGSPAVITNSNLSPPAGTVGVPFLYQITTAGSQPITLTTSQLPAGLTLVGNNIQGTPTASAVTTNGSFPVTLTATNAFQHDAVDEDPAAHHLGSVAEFHQLRICLWRRRHTVPLRHCRHRHAADHLLPRRDCLRD